jgi:hypothetical protein
MPKNIHKAQEKEQKKLNFKKMVSGWLPISLTANRAVNRYSRG